MICILSIRRESLTQLSYRTNNGSFGYLFGNMSEEFDTNYITIHNNVIELPPPLVTVNQASFELSSGFFGWKNGEKKVVSNRHHPLRTPGLRSPVHRIDKLCPGLHG